MRSDVRRDDVAQRHGLQTLRKGDSPVRNVARRALYAVGIFGFVTALSACSFLMVKPTPVPEPPDQTDTTPGPQGFLLFEDFETGTPGQVPEGWKISVVSSSPDHPKIATAPAGLNPPSGNQVLVVNRTVGESVNSSLTYVDFDPLDGRVVVSMWLHPTSHVRSLNFSMRGTTTGGTTVFRPNSESSIFFTLNTSGSDVRIRVYSPEGGWIDGPILAKNVWHKVTLDIDVPANSVDVYVNGTATELVNLPFVNPTLALTGLSFGYQSTTGQENNPSPVYVDDLVVTDCQGAGASLCP